MRYKNVLMICVLTLMLMLFMMSCDWFPGSATVGPSDPDDPPATGATFEILYERVLPIVNPDAPDPTGGWATFFHSTYGGQLSTYWQKVEGTDNKWQAERYLEYSKTEYAVSNQDLKVDPTGNSVLKNVYMRKKGQSEWKLLSHTIKMMGAEWLEFIADNIGIHNPNASGNL